MQVEEITQILRESPSVRLIKSRSVDFFLSFVIEAFEGQAAIMQERLHMLLENRLDEQENTLVEDDSEMTRLVESNEQKAKRLIKDWTDKGFLTNYQNEEGEVIYEISSHTSKLIDWVVSLKKEDYIGTESKFKTLFSQLKEANNRVKILQEQLAGVRKEIGLLDDENNEAIKKKTLSENRENKLKERRNESNSALAQIGVVDTDTFESQHTDLLNVALEDLNGKRDTLQHEIDLALQKQRETKSRKNSDLKNLIYRFKNPAEEITMKYHDWRSDVSRLPEAVEFMGEYQAYYQRLLDEDLPGFESRFNKYLQENIINKVSAFNVFFQNWCQSITKTIDQLNSYLIGIDFKDAPKTYIQLVATKRLNVDVKEFQNLLSSAIPNIHEMNSTIDGSKIHFEQHIEPLMSRLQVESWRKSVMDVRGWYTYKSEEFYQDDGQKRNTYEAMGQLSGGEKAQLTYTILGSAIAYQFGLTKSGLDSSFRFIAIDEAFRAQDEDKARYLISLCKQLHLQLLVVTPSDNIHIVENDISYVHYVERKGNCSVLYNMPISEFKAERERSMEV